MFFSNSFLFQRAILAFLLEGPHCKCRLGARTTMVSVQLVPRDFAPRGLGSACVLGQAADHRISHLYRAISTCEMQSGFKLGIVYIGKAGGKHKYSLLDGKDISLVRKFRFEAKVEVDKDGNGANIYAYAFDLTKQKHKGCYFHEYIWERHCGGIAPGYQVAHKNSVSVDNRLENLYLVPRSKKVKYRHTSNEDKTDSCSNDDEPHEDQSLYWMAVSRLPPFDAQEKHFIDMNYNKFYNANGEQVEEEDDALSFYECHFPPCCKMESELREFSICGRCHQVRYCGTACQQRDWPNHKKFCKEKAKQRMVENTPER